MSNLKGRIIIPALGFGRLSEDAFMSRLNAIEKGMDGNPAYPNPPVSPAELKAAIAAYAVSSAAALDGSKTAVADRKRKRADLTIMARLLGHHVEVACNGNMATFLSSGFEAATTTRTAPQPLPQPSIVKVDQGRNSGQLLVTIKPLSKARNYDLRYAALGSGGAPGQWTTITVPSAKQATAIDGLSAGTTYTFQVRAYGKLGYTDWSDTVMRMCI
jgi:hypothetical protein